jgi:hypothetical protein
MNISSGWKIGKLYRASGSTWNLEILTEKDTRLRLRVVDANGRAFMQQSLTVSSSSPMIPLNLSGLAGGQYFVHLVSDQGEASVRAIQKE